MNKYIKYKRFNKTFDYNISLETGNDSKIQEFFDNLISEGYEVISYDEKINKKLITIVLFCGKIRNIL